MEEQGGIELLDYLRICRRRWVSILVAVLVCTVSSLIFESHKPVTYTVSSDIMIDEPHLADQIRGGQLSLSTRPEDLKFQFFVDHVKSDECIGYVISTEVLGEAPAPKTPSWFAQFEALHGMTKAERLGEQRVVRISVTHPSPETASKIANAYGVAYGASLERAAVVSSAQLEAFLDSEIARAEKEVSGFQSLIDATMQNTSDALGTLSSGFFPALAAARNSLASSTEPSLVSASMDALTAELPKDCGEAVTSTLKSMQEARVAYDQAIRGMHPSHPAYKSAVSNYLRTARAFVEAVEASKGSSHESHRESRGEISISGEVFVPDPLSRTRYQTELGIRQQLLGELVKKKSEIRMASASIRGMVQWVKAAVPPGVRKGPQMELAFNLGSTVGLLLGFCIAFCLETMDKSLRNPFFVHRFIGAPLMAVIPKITTPRGIGSKQLAEPHSPSGEAYRMLAHRVVVSKKKVFAVTSAGPQEGKSTTTANLSVALAEIGNRVLVVSANLRRPTLHAFFGVAESPGIREAVSGSMPASPVQTPVKDVMLLPSGSGDSSGISETLASSKFPEMITRLAAGFDYVVVDVPPAGAVADLFHLNTVIDAVLIVCMVGRAKTQSVQAVAGSVREMGLEVVGVVLNDAAGSGMPEYGYSYGYDASGQAQ